MINKQAFCAAVLQRAGRIHKRRARMLSGAAIAGGLSFVTAMGVTAPFLHDSATFDTVAGQATLFADGSVGAFVLVGLVSFALGMAVMWACMRMLKR